MRTNVRTNELKAEIVRNGLSIAEVAAALGLHRETVYTRLKNPSKFTYVDVKKLVDLLGLSDDKIVSLFFDTNVS